MMAELQDQAIRQHCKALRMPTIGTQFARLADAAAREGQSHVGYLEALLAAEMEERESRAIIRLLGGDVDLEGAVQQTSAEPLFGRQRSRSAVGKEVHRHGVPAAGAQPFLDVSPHPRAMHAAVHEHDRRSR